MYGGEGEKTRDEMWQMERRNIDNNAGVSMDGVILAAAARGDACMRAGAWRWIWVPCWAYESDLGRAWLQGLQGHPSLGTLRAPLYTCAARHHTLITVSLSFPTITIALTLLAHPTNLRQNDHDGM